MNKKILKKLWSNYFRLQGLLETGVAGLTDLILSLDELLSGREPVLHKTSLFGEFFNAINSVSPLTPELIMQILPSILIGNV